MLKYSTEIDNLIEQLTEPTPEKSKSENSEISKLDHSDLTPEIYQNPVKVGKAGKPIDEGDDLWIVGTFLPGQHINETHKTGHNGVDIKAPMGTPIYPIASGKVIEAQQYPKGGITCKISHENGQVVSYYAHMSALKVSNGQEVTPQTIIGLVGDTGNAKGRGAHLHFEIKVHGTHVDPLTIPGKVVGSLTQTTNSCLITLVNQYLGTKQGANIINKFSSGKKLGDYLIKIKKN